MSKKLDAIAAEIFVCTKCGLSQSRKNAVPGEGCSDARVVLIGEAPGRFEDLKGRPFVGAAGKFLEAMLLKVGLSRDKVFICNVLKCRPLSNRPPKPDEIRTCTPYLNRQLRIIKPKFVVSLGNYSTAFVFSRVHLPFTSITQAHGKAYDASLHGRRIVVFPMFHPAAALYSAKYKEQITSDFERLRLELEKGR